MEKVERQSNIELMKIIAMFLICISHVVNPIINDYSFPAFTMGWDMVYTLIKNLGWIGDYMFIAASAYFLVGNKKFQWRKIILYYVEVLIVFFLYLGIFELFNYPTFDIGTYEVSKALTLNTTIIFKYWYIIAYIIYLATLPLFNRLIDILPKKIHCVLAWSSIPMGFALLIISNLLYSGIWIECLIFFFMTFIMSYGKKYGWYLCFREDDKKGLIIGLVLAVFAWILTNVIFNYLGVYASTWQYTSRHVCDIHFPIYYIIGITVFLLFKNMEIKSSKIINYISSLSLIFYVMHHNRFTYFLFEPQMLNLIKSNPIQLRLLILLGSAIIRFIYGIVLAALYNVSIHRLLYWLTNLRIKKRDNETEIKQNEVM